MSPTFVSIDHQPIQTRDGIPLAIEQGRNGAVVSFEGRIRSFHKGKEVHKIIYECYRPLAMKEMHRILCAANEQFGLSHSFIIHRIGEVSIGETAVWTGTISPHRREAFAACAFIMDELKLSVPIWKKEFYADGTISWPGWQQSSETGQNLQSPS